jgi:hypothetical protein
MIGVAVEVVFWENNELEMKMKRSNKLFLSMFLNVIMMRENI